MSQEQKLSVPPDLDLHHYNSQELQNPDLVLMAARVQRLHLAMEGAVLSVQRMLVTFLAGLDHFNGYLNVAQCLERRNKVEKKIHINIFIEL